MNTNRSSYLIGAALGSALVLALCAPANAADIYEGGLKGGYDVPPPPPTDRGIYFKGYVGAADANVGDIWTEQLATGTGIVHHKDIKSTPLFGLGLGWQARHWLRFDLTGEYRGDALFVAHDQFPGANTNEYTADIRSWMGLANAYIDMGNWCGFTPFIGAGIGFATLTVYGMKDINNVRRNSVAFGATTPRPTSPTPSTPVAASTSPRRWRSSSPTATPTSARRRAAASPPLTALASNSGVFVQDITSNDVMLGMRYKFQREAVVYQPVK